MDNFTLSQRAIDALLAVREAIAIDQGRSFDMKQWGSETACGTTFCIAGHLAILFGAKPDFSDCREYSTNEYNLGEDDFKTESGQSIPLDEIIKDGSGIPREVANELYYVTSWPINLQNIYGSGSKVEAAQAAIDWFIAKYAPKEAHEENKGEDLQAEAQISKVS